MRRPPRGHDHAHTLPSRLLVLLAAIALAGALAACGSSGSAGQTSAPKTSAVSAPTASASAPASDGTITIKNFAFSPSTLTVKSGTKVTVRNDDQTTHTVTAVAPHSGAFNTGDIAPGATVTFSAPSTPGTYGYFCMIHQFMHGTLVVR